LPTLFENAVAVRLRLDSDRETPYADRVHRDRAIGAALTAKRPAAKVRAWLGALPPDDGPAPQAPALAARLAHGRSLVTLLMIALGAAAGAPVAAAVLHYDGEYPVNVVTVLAVLVGVQLLLVAATVLTMSLSRLAPRAVRSLFGRLSVAGVVADLYRRHIEPDSVLGRTAASLFGRDAGGAPAAARFSRWQWLTWSQTAGVAFNVAALAVAGALITFTDLAFGWSTTLGVGADDALRVAELLAAPWRDVWPAAVPGTALIESSRYFRLATGAPANVSPAALTGWWPFIVASIICYGLVPRVVLLALSAWRLRAATVGLLLDDPRVTALLDRMNAPEVAMRASAPAASPEGLAGERATPPFTAARSGIAPAAGIVWSGALGADDARGYAASHLGWTLAHVADAGGDRPLEADRAAIETVAAARPAVVFVFVRCWEPPLLDFVDFLRELRGRIGERTSLVVVPVAPGTDAVDSAASAPWSRALARLADPHLYLEAGRGEGSRRD
jgi:hypothetical protein